MSESLPTPPPPRGRLIDAHLVLFDRQVLDPNDVPVTTVDDLELSHIPDATPLDPEHPPVITDVLSGPVLATRMFGGRPPRSRFHRIPWSDVTDVGITTHISVPAEHLDMTWVERWAGAHIIAHIPGGRHDPE